MREREEGVAIKRERERRVAREICLTESKVQNKQGNWRKERIEEIRIWGESAAQKTEKNKR